MNPAALFFSCLLVGQIAPPTQPAPSDTLGPRYQNAGPATPLTLPGGTKPHGSRPHRPAGELPQLPGGTAGAPPVQAEATGDQLPNLPLERSPAAGGQVPDNLTDNPFQDEPNPLRPPVGNSSGEAAEQPFNSNPGSEPGSFIPDEQFVPPKQLIPDESSASSFTPAVIDKRAIESRVVPAAATGDARLIPVQPAEKEQVAERLVREALTPPEVQSLAGQPVTLDQLLSEGEAVQQQHLAIVQAYWKLCTAVSRYNLAWQAQGILEQATGGRQLPLNTAADLSAIKAETVQARAAAVDAQYALAVLRGTARGNELPLPVDRPVVTSYRTYYESIFPASRQTDVAARRALRLHTTLPLRLEAIHALADSIETGQSFVQAAAQVSQTGQVDYVTLAAAVRQLHTQRMALLAEVQAYNQSIADYAGLAISPGASANSLLPMLIKVKPKTNVIGGVTVTPPPSLQAVPGAGGEFTSLPAAGSTGVLTPSGTFVPGGVIQTSGELPIQNTLPVATSPTGKQYRSVLVRSGRLP